MSVVEVRLLPFFSFPYYSARPEYSSGSSFSSWIRQFCSPYTIYRNPVRLHDESGLERRLLILPIVWGVFGILLVYALRFTLGTITDSVPYNPNDKPIGGSVLPVLFFNAAAILTVVLLTLYSVGFWRPNLSSRRAKIELGGMMVLLGSGFMLWYAPVFLFTSIASLVVLMATNIE